ncbi:MAG: heparinase II/III family protein [Burkholderiaceae bacterium]|nr:heparinase II/III family protein [Burkholderiaceae bacterium]
MKTFSPSGRAQSWLVAALFLPTCLPACSDSSPSDKALAAAFIVSAQSVPRSALWDDPERLPAVPLPSGDGKATTASSVVDILAKVPSAIYYGPRVAREDWEALGKRYRSDPSVLRWVRNEQARVDAWMDKHFEGPNRVGGWPLAYIDPRTGAPITWTPDSQEPPDEPAGIDDTKSALRAWVAISRDYNIVHLLTAARIYRVSGQRRYADWAAQQLDFYASYYANGPLRTHEGRSTLYAQGLDEAVAVFKLLDAARLLRDAVDPARYAVWRDKLFEPMAANLKVTSAPMSNIQLWHQMARAAIAMRFGDTALLDEAQRGPQGIDAVMAADLTADNFWIEGTFAYNTYVIQGLATLLAQAGIEGYADRFAALRDEALRMLLVTFDYRFDDNTLPNPNDSRGVQEVIAPYAHWLLYRTAPTYWGLARANTTMTWESLLDPPATVPTEPPMIPAARTRNFPSVRQAVLRAGDWQAYVHYGASIANHVQQELTTFELHDGKTVIARDPGTVDYGSPYHTEYFQRGTANNVPLIDGEGQTGWAPGQIDQFDATQDRLAVTHAHYQPDARVTRAYRLTTQGFVERSAITIPSGQSRRLGVVFNTGCDVKLGRGTSPAVLEAPPAVPAMQKYWTSLNMAAGVTEWEATLDCSGHRYLMTVRGPAGMHIYTATAPDTPLPAKRQAIYYEVRDKSATFEAEFKRAP